MQREVVITCQYQENYGFSEGKFAWKNKGGHEFRFSVDMDILMYSQSTLVEVVKEMLKEHSNDACQYLFVSLDLAESVTRLDDAELMRRVNANLEKRAQVLEDDQEQEYEPDMDDRDDDYDSGMSYSQQCAADRADYANEMLQQGKIDPEQAAEIRAGA